jgi:hypothetical protein
LILFERLAAARRAWPSAMSDDDIVRAARTGLDIAAAELPHASDETRQALWNGYFRYLYARKASYQFQDFEIVDYGLCASGTLGLLRGPPLGPDVLESGNYICLVGAAQFFGRLVRTSLQEMIAQRFSVPVLNLSFGGAGPQAFLNENVAALLRKAKLVVVQVMSGRSIGCDEYPGGMTTRRKDTGERVNRELLLLEVARREPREFARLVEKWLKLYVEAYAQIAARIEGRSILVWMSKRRPKGWSIESGLAKTALGTYPQMVTAPALDAIKRHFAHYIECREPYGAFEFVSRIDGRPCPFVVADGTLKWSTGYYPSPQSHRLAFELLEPLIEEMIAAPRGGL